MAAKKTGLHSKAFEKKESPAMERKEGSKFEKAERKAKVEKHRFGGKGKGK